MSSGPHSVARDRSQARPQRQTVAVTTPPLAPLLARYGGRLHVRADGAHHVASPLGAWLVVAPCAPLARGGLRSQLSEVLGVDPEEAARLAAELITHPHPAGDCGVAVWNRRDIDPDELRRWRAMLPALVESGDVPDQRTLDAWAKARTLGLIDRFPLELDPRTCS
jgi:hypothetical protein